MKDSPVNLIDRDLLFYLFHTVAFCSISALSWTLLDRDKGFLDSFILNQCVGLLALSCNLLLVHVILPNNRLLMVMEIMAGMIIGTTLAVPLGSAIAGKDLLELFDGEFYRLLLLTILGGAVIGYFQFTRWTIASKESLVQKERFKLIEIEKKAVETHLRLLQAQIEPHFLFNTLSNILSLLETDVKKGRSMLMDLMRYLRTTLSGTRRDTTTIGAEMEAIRAYLNIFKIRMGDRLSYEIDVAEEITDFPFQPMLIQPLVENAIIHGLDPAIKGGEIWIRGAVRENIVRLEVVNTGAGLYENSNPGMAIDNIRERLKSLYGKARANVNYFQTMLDATEIRAPISGTVLRRIAEVGEMVTTSFAGATGAKSAVIALADLNDLQVEMDISQTDFNRISGDHICKMTPEAYPDKVYDCRIDEIAPEANRPKASIQVKVKVLHPDAHLRPEMSARVTFLKREEKRDEPATH